MATKKSTLVIISLLTLVVGYVVGGFLGLPSTNSDSISGDIGKVNRHKAAVVSDDEALMEQKLRTDSTFMAQTSYTLAFISARIGEFKENAALTADIAAKYPQIQKYQQPMTDLAAIAANAQTSAASALTALSKIANGEGGSSYEEFSNNAILSYLLLEKGLSTSTDFVTDVDAFLKGKKVVDYQSLALVRDMWVNYNLVTAVINEDNALVAYWNKAGNKLTVDQSKLALANAPALYQNNVAIAGLFNAQVLGNASERFNLANSADRLGIVANSQALQAQGRMYQNGQLCQALVLNSNGKIDFAQKDALGAQSAVTMFMFPADLHANVAIAVNAKIDANASLNANASINFSNASLGQGARINGFVNSQDMFGVSSRLGAIVGRVDPVVPPL